MYRRSVAAFLLRCWEFCSSLYRADVAKCVGTLPNIQLGAVFELNLRHSASRLDIVLPSAQSVSPAPRLHPYYWWRQMNKCWWAPTPTLLLWIVLLLLVTEWIQRVTFQTMCIYTWKGNSWKYYIFGCFQRLTLRRLMSYIYIYIYIYIWSTHSWCF